MSLQIRAQAELELRRRRRDGEQNAYRTFQDEYFDRFGLFLNRAVDWEPTSYQIDIAQRLARSRRVAVRGPHGLGKTALAALAVHWFALTRDGICDWKIPTTASAWRQLTHYLWPEIGKWARRLKWDVIGRPAYRERDELLTQNLKLSTGEAFALASNKPELIEGAHGEQLLYVFDEAKVIPAGTWDSAEGAFSTGDCYWLAISTPGDPNGRFYDIHSRASGYEDWDARHVSLEEAIKAGRINRDWAETRKRQWGETSAAYHNRVLGEFASSDEDSVIPLAWVEAANERWHEQKDGPRAAFVGVGVDVGRGGDASVWALRFGNYVDKLRRANVRDTMQVTGKTVGILDQNGGKAVVDVIGIGAGVVDRLREIRQQRGASWDVVAFVAGARTDRKDASGEMGFVDVRSAAWWTLRELLDPYSGEDVALPPDDLLIGDLTAPKWSTRSGGKIKVESKDEIRKRIGRSTDSGDAVVQVFWEGRQWGGVVSSVSIQR